MLFFPLKDHLLDPRDHGIDYHDIYIETEHGQKMHGWLLPQTGELKATVLFLHGNGENISTHIGAVHWLPKFGYRVILIDYRGYGRSDGEATLDGAVVDIQYAIKYALENKKDREPLIVMGQSIGASMSIYAVSVTEDRQNIDGLILVAPFSDYQKIAQEALGKSWLTWLFQYPLSWTISNRYDPEFFIKAIKPVPAYFIHGTSDEIISTEHSLKLYQLANPPKKIFFLEGGHNNLATTEKFRNVLLDVLKEISSSTPNSASSESK